VAGMAASSRRVLERAGLSSAHIDRFVGHQANARILVAVAERLGVPLDRCVLNVARYGNTSAASIPLALAEGGLQPDDRVLLTAFGAGLTWGSALLRWPDLALDDGPSVSVNATTDPIQPTDTTPARRSS
jgi:3-oxoacyl-[acyl-carrier-protein] synthase III